MARFTTMAPVTSRTGPPILWEEMDEDEPLNPECIIDTDRPRSDKPPKREQVYRRREVTWLNFSPGTETAQELAVTFLTVGVFRIFVLL